MIRIPTAVPHHAATRIAAAVALALVAFQSCPARAGGDGRKPTSSKVVLNSGEHCPSQREKPKTVTIEGGGKAEIDNAVKALNALHARVEEWGVATISAPIAVFEPGAFKVPDNFVSTREAYDAYRTDKQGSVDIKTSRTIENTLTATVTQPAITPKTTTSSSTTTTSTTSDTGTGDAASSAAAAKADADKATAAATDATQKANLADQAATRAESAAADAAAKAKSSSKAPALSVAQAGHQALNSTIGFKIFGQMSNPHELPGYNKVIFAIVQVSCNPGWRTQEHYIADCSASMEYYDMCRETQLSRAARRQPTVFSVLPLVDAQTVEMSRSQKEVTQLILDLTASFSANAVPVTAKDLFKFVKEYSRDLKSVTPIPVVNSYSSGGTFGFRFSPSFQAQKDPAQKKARAANVLLPTTFPALITVVTHNVDLAAASREFANKREQELGEKKKSLEEGWITHDMAIMTHVSTRWYLKDRPPLWQFPKHLFVPMKRDRGGVEAAMNVATAYHSKECYKQGTSWDPCLIDPSTGTYGAWSKRVGLGHFNPAYEEIRRQIIDLESKAVGRSWPIPLAENQAGLMELVKAQAGEIFGGEKRALERKLELLQLQVKIKAEEDKLNAPSSTRKPGEGTDPQPATEPEKGGAANRGGNRNPFLPVGPDDLGLFNQDPLASAQIAPLPLPDLELKDPEGEKPLSSAKHDSKQNGKAKAPMIATGTANRLSLALPKK